MTVADRQGIAVAVCVNEGWLWQAAYLLHCIAAADQGGRLRLFLFLDGARSDEPVFGAFPPGVTIRECAGVLDDAARPELATTKLPRVTMLRFFAIDALTADHARVIYLDADIMLRWGDLADLADVPLTENPLQAVRSRSHWSSDPTKIYNFRYIRRLSREIRGRYFNAGFLVVNSEVYAAEETGARALDFFGRNRELCKYDDQSALNAVVAGRWDELSPGWNWQVSTRNYPLLESRSPRLIHFTGPRKPWNDALLIFEAYFADMRRFLQEQGLEAILIAQERAFGFSLKREELRMTRMALWAGDGHAKWADLCAYLDREDFADRQAGVRAYRYA